MTMQNNSTQYFFGENDLLSCHILSAGRTLCNFRLTGAKSLKDIYMRVIQEANGQRGMVTMKLRNRTQGWVQSKSLMLAV